MGFVESELKVVVVDDDDQRKNLIKSFLPQYMNVTAVSYGEEAIEAMRPDKDEKTDLVIMYADDKNGKSLTTFETMISSHRNEKLFMIPVLLITEDEFSDRAMDFLEIGEVSFYEYKDEIKEHDFFSAVMDAVEQGALMEEEDFPAFPPVYDEIPSSPDRIMGMTFVMTDLNKPQRSAVIQGEDRIQELLKAVKSSKEKTVQVRKYIEEVNKEREEAGLPPVWTPVPKEQRKPKEVSYNKPAPTKRKITLDPKIASNLFKIDDSQVGILLSEDESVPANNAGLRSNPSSNINGVTYTRTENTVNENVRDTNRYLRLKSGKKIVLVVDSDARTEKACHLFLEDKYEFILVDSGMKAIDYFVRNTADIVLMEYNLTSLNGERVLQSIRLQPNGAMVPVVMTFTKETMAETKARVSQNKDIRAFVEKPITKKQLVAAINACR